MDRVTRALGAAALALAAGSAAAQEHELRLHHFLPAGSTAQKDMLEPWAERIEEASGGRVAIEIFPAMTLGGRPPELVGQARDGIVDLIWTLNGYTPGVFQRTEVFELPNVYVNDIAAANLAMREMFETHLAEDYAGLEVMFLHVHAGQAIHTVDKEVRAPADFEGMAIRIPTRSGAWVIEELGAEPASMPVPDLPQALSKQAVDGAFIPFEIIPALSLQEQTRYQIEGENNARFGTSVFQVSMNQATWDGLPEDIRQVFRDASGEAWLREVAEVWRAAEETGIEVATEAGNEHVVLTAEETAAMLEALSPVVDRWIEDVSGQGIDGQGIARTARETIRKHGSDAPAIE